MTEIAVRATGRDGYDVARLMPALEIDRALVTFGSVLVAEDSAVVGAAALRHTGLGGMILLDRLFVDPDAKRHGIGRLLFGSAVAQAKAMGGSVLLIYANPVAAGFYARMGAMRIGEAPYPLMPEVLTPIFVLSIG